MASQEAADGQNIRFACQSPEIQSFAVALADSLLGEGISAEGPPFSVESFKTQAAKIPFYGSSDEDFQRMLNEISSIATRGRAMLEALKRVAAPRLSSTPPTPASERGGGGARGNRESSPAPSSASSYAASSAAGGSASKRPRAATAGNAEAPSGAPPIGDDSHLALLGQGIADAAASRTSNAPAFANDAEIEKEYFSPLLVETNAARRKICAAVEKLGTLLVDMPADKILSASAREFAQAKLQDGADESASFDECASLVAELIEQFEVVRVATAHLRRSCSHMMRIYMLAHHTTGAGWNTVAQLCYREVWDREMLGLQDGFKPLATWEEKVMTAMRLCKQDKHLTKEGTPMGPLCPRLLKRSFGTHSNPNTPNAGRGRHTSRGGGGRGRFGRGGSYGGRRGGHGKENARPGRNAAGAGRGGGGGSCWRRGRLSSLYPVAAATSGACCRKAAA